MTPGSAGGRQATVAREPIPVPQPVRALATNETAPFSAAGAVSVTPSGEVPKWKVQTGGLIEEITATLDTAGSSSTVVTAYLNGVSIGTVTLASSDTDETDLITPVRAVPGDVIGARITTAGTGAKGLSAFVVMKG